MKKLLNQLNTKLIAKWMVGDFSAILNKYGSSVEESKISCDDLTDLLKKLDEDKISDPAAKKIIEILWNENITVEEIIERENLKQISNEDDIGELKRVIRENPKQLEQYRNGKRNSLDFLLVK